MPMGDYKDFGACVQDVMDDKGLSKDRAEKYCGAIKEKVEKEADWEYTFGFEKIAGAGDRRIIAGYASHGEVDADGDIMDMDSLRTVFTKYMENPVVRFMHNRSGLFTGAIGKVIPEFQKADGTVLRSNFDNGKPFLVVEISKSQLVDPIWKMIEEGMYKGFSIGGKAAKRIKEFRKGGVPATRIIAKSWNETSVVDTPAAQGSFFDVVKMACDNECGCPIKIVEETEMSIEFSKRLESFDQSANSFMKQHQQPTILDKFMSGADGFMKGGKGSGVKGHRTAKSWKKLSTSELKTKRKELMDKGRKAKESGIPKEKYDDIFSVADEIEVEIDARENRHSFYD